MNRTVFLAAILLLLALGVRFWPWKEVRYGPGPVAPGDPLQQMLGQPTVREVSGGTIVGVAQYSILARVLSTRRYRFEPGHELVPIDVAVGWGPMSDEAVLDKLDISQSSRAYFYEWMNPPPLPPAVIASHSANMHLIPASSQIASALYGLPVGAIVRLRGELVNARTAEGGEWHTSLSRTDTGAGACELFYVQSFERFPKPVIVVTLQAAR